MTVNPVIVLLAGVRQAAGMSQQQVAQAMGTRQSTVSELESGGSPNPCWSTLTRYAAAVGVQLEVRITRTRAPSTPPASPGSPAAPDVTDNPIYQHARLGGADHVEAMRLAVDPDADWPVH